MKIPSLVVFLNVRFKDTLAIHVLQRPDVAIVILHLETSGIIKVMILSLTMIGE